VKLVGSVRNTKKKMIAGQFRVSSLAVLRRGNRDYRLHCAMEKTGANVNISAKRKEVEGRKRPPGQGKNII